MRKDFTVGGGGDRVVMRVFGDFVDSETLTGCLGGTYSAIVHILIFDMNVVLCFFIGMILIGTARHPLTLNIISIPLQHLPRRIFLHPCLSSITDSIR